LVSPYSLLRRLGTSAGIPSSSRWAGIAGVSATAVVVGRAVRIGVVVGAVIVTIVVAIRVGNRRAIVTMIVAVSLRVRTTGGDVVAAAAVPVAGHYERW